MTQTHQITLPGSLTIENVEALGNELKGIPFSEGLQLSLDASQVDIVTTPGIQLLLSLSKALASHNGNLKLINPRSGFLDAFSQLGLTDATASWEQVHE